MSPSLLTLVCVFGFVLAYLYGRHTKQFRWREYVALLAAPILCVSFLTFVHGVRVLYLFLASSVVGLILEYGVGLTYHKTLNRRLWTYTRYGIGGYTSWLAAPMWGIAGVVFWVLSSRLGL